MKTYGAGVNVYVNEFALYNYLAEENDWLGLADYSQRKKVTRLKPHNVFGYVNFPEFDENEETLRISNERADFIQDLTFSKVMYLLKGVIMFMILKTQNIKAKNIKLRLMLSLHRIQTTAQIQTMMLNKAKREQKTTRVILQQVILQEIAQQQPKLRPLLIRVHMNLLELILPKS